MILCNKIKTQQISCSLLAHGLITLFLNYYTFLLTSLALIGDVVDKHTGVPNSHTGTCCQPPILSTTMYGQMTDKQREGNDKYLPRVKT